MAWPKSNWIATDLPTYADFNTVALAFATWGGNVDAGAHTLSNVGNVTLASGSSLFLVGAGAEAGVGTTTPNSILSVAGVDDARVNVGTTGTGINIIDSQANSSSTTSRWLRVNPTGGLVRVGDTGNPSFLLHLAIDSAAKPSTSTWTVSSDARLKRNVQTMTDDSVSLLGKLRFIRGEYNGLGGIPAGSKVMGLVAQEVQAVLPDAVRTVNGRLNPNDPQDTALLTIDYHAVIVHSARAIAQLDARIAALEHGKP